MFHSISENPPHRVGKIFCDLSYFGKSTTFAPGREDWNLKKISHNHEKFEVSNKFLYFDSCIKSLEILPTTTEAWKLQIEEFEGSHQHRRWAYKIRKFSPRFFH